MEQKKKHCEPLQLFILLNVGKHLREYITDLDFTSGLSLSCKSPVGLFSILIANLLLNQVMTKVLSDSPGLVE